MLIRSVLGESHVQELPAQWPTAPDGGHLVASNHCSRWTGTELVNKQSAIEEATSPVFTLTYLLLFRLILRSTASVFSSRSSSPSPHPFCCPHHGASEGNPPDCDVCLVSRRCRTSRCDRNPCRCSRRRFLERDMPRTLETRLGPRPQRRGAGTSC